MDQGWNPTNQHKIWMKGRAQAKCTKMVLVKFHKSSGHEGSRIMIFSTADERSADSIVWDILYWHGTQLGWDHCWGHPVLTWTQVWDTDGGTYDHVWRQFCYCTVTPTPVESDMRRLVAMENLIRHRLPLCKTKCQMKIIWFCNINQNAFEGMCLEEVFNPFRVCWVNAYD